MQRYNKMIMKEGIFTISIDFEFAWGYVDKDISASQKEDIKKEVEITRKLINLFEKYDVPVTWAIVGKLLEPGDDLLWHDTENLIPLIKNSKAGHEIGSHSYSHIIYGENSEEVVREDITKAQEIHQRNNLTFKSFVFPRNSEGYYRELREAGITSFRHNEHPSRLTHFLSYFWLGAVSGLPEVHSSGLMSIPGGMLLIGRNGLRKLIPSNFIIKKAKNSLKSAEKNKKIFHLWFHPSNFAYDTDNQFRILEEILKTAKSLNIKIMTMNEIATEFKESEKGENKAVSSHHDNASVFADRYKVYEKNPYASAFTYDRKKLFEFLLSFIDKNLKVGDKVLDVGSGTGYFSNLLEQKSFAVSAVEPAEGMREYSQNNYPGINFQNASLSSLPFADNSFDTVFAIEVFRYLNLEEQIQGYRECLRVLKPGGKLVVTLVNKYALDGFYIKYKFFALLEKLGIKELPNYCDFRTPDSIRKFFTSKLNINNNNIHTGGVLFASTRLAYKISPKFGQWFAHKIENLDNILSIKPWHQKFSGYLVLVVKK